MHNVKQAKPSNRSIFELKYLREFIDGATALGFPDTTPVRCSVTWTGDLRYLETMLEGTGGDTDIGGPPMSTPVRPDEAGGGSTDKRTIVTQDSTGPRVEWRRWGRWGRQRSAQVLTLGDVRALIARVDELGLPTDIYAVRASAVDRSWRGHVYSISAEPISR